MSDLPGGKFSGAYKNQDSTHQSVDLGVDASPFYLVRENCLAIEKENGITVLVDPVSLPRTNKVNGNVRGDGTRSWNCDLTFFARRGF